MKRTNLKQMSDWREDLSSGSKVSLGRVLLMSMLLLAFSGGASAQTASPQNLAETDVTTNSAVLSWDGTSDSYVLQYRPWYPSGDDVITTSVMTTYTYDLSAYSGVGSVAIRHYDVTDMYRLLVDDIVVKNASGVKVFTENFENCDGNIPASFTMMDLDHDGFGWTIVSSPASNVNGSYGIASASYSNLQGPLTPDNWLIISDIEMGGSISFNARGQDKSYAAENFAVYISTEAGMIEVPLTTTTYTATNLEPNTPYAWQVKGISGGVESTFVSGFFKTMDNVLVFATNGAWDNVANWTDAEGNAISTLPTYDNNVRIDAHATIADGVMAYAGKATIDGGSITIEEGGQMKHKAATLKVTMKKNVAGYGNGGAYCLFASPFSGRTKLEYDPNWSNVTGATTGEYDLYTFDATAANEWINYKKSPSHLSFQGEINGNPGLVYGEGYLYANQANTTLTFTGTTSLSCNNTITNSITYNAASTNAYNGWMLVGNMFTCDGTVSFVNGNDELLGATFYKLNAAGDGFVACEGAVVLAPGEGAFMHYTQSGKVKYSSEVAPDAPDGVAAEDFVVMPQHALAVHQDAGPLMVLANDAVNNSAVVESFNGQAVHVKLAGRTLYKDGEWNTICLPFNVTLDGSPLDGAIAKTLTSASMTGTHVTLGFGEAVDMLEAGKPYIIKWELPEGPEVPANIVDPVFRSVTVVNSAAADRTITLADGNVNFIGYYDAFTINTPANDDIYYMTAGNSLKHTGKERTLKACRAYFQFAGEGGAAREFMLDFGDSNETTSISEKGIVKSEASAPATWYTLDGRKVDVGAGVNGDSQSPVPASLPKGLYIHNGRKVVIK